ncbi:prepilin-type N-terminal cleavage/methylation domain-containing protein [Pseudomonas sp. ITA]|uniref:prepilin-type N-terminal cleavage/methylation domain-containing protein n=1 Tax=Pseudomonas sp. ITA TaxID=2825841 RepID=UPI00249960D4|nr:prepilin-type N-terminal cleavage/methylation domain-containing protein [Pseudomonas sp. ITA]MDI2146188.1 prepilin-type N-terminal cleavage/methylation domain-containing protein [Pseudomonas sp. ITA]
MRRSELGFTLIEVMIALVLMSIVSLIAWRGLDSVTHADTSLKDRNEQAFELLRALNQLERDVEMRANIELSASSTPGRDTPVAALTVEGREQQGFRLDVVRRSASQPGSLQRISWWVEDGILYRAVGQPRKRYPVPAPKDGVAVLEHLQSSQLRVWEAGRGWRLLSGNSQTNPLGVEIELVRKTPQGLERYRQVLGPLN